VEGNLQLEDVPDYADIVNYEPQAADSTAAAGVSSQSLFDEIWSSVIGSAEARVRKPDAPVVAGIPHPRIRLAGVSRR
jgi:hypothetical protein